MKVYTYEVLEIDANDRVTFVLRNQTEFLARLAVNRLRTAYGQTGLRRYIMRREKGE